MRINYVYHKNIKTKSNSNWIKIEEDGEKFFKLCTHVYQSSDRIDSFWFAEIIESKIKNDFDSLGDSLFLICDSLWRIILFLIQIH